MEQAHRRGKPGLGATMNVPTPAGWSVQNRAVAAQAQLDYDLLWLPLPPTGTGKPPENDKIVQSLKYLHNF